MLDVCNLLKNEGHFQVRIINFDFDRRYPKTDAEISRRTRVIKSELGDIPIIQPRALRMKLPFQKRTSNGPFGRFVNTYLHFVPLDRKFFRCLRDSDVIYYIQTQRGPAYLFAIMCSSFVSGSRPVIVGIHATPDITPFERAVLRIFSRIGILKGIHIIDRTFKSVFDKVGCPVEYIPNGIYFERFNSNVSEKFTQQEFRLIFVGAMTHVKGADLIPGIYDALVRHHFPFKFTICTSGGVLTEKIRSWSKDKDDVDFLGFVEQRELASLYKESSVALFPSEREAWGLACVEAQASGTPVVVSDVLGFRQTVIDGRTGFLIPDHNPELFASRIADLYMVWKDNRNRYVEICRNAQENVKENFQWKHALNRLVVFLGRALT